MKQNVILDLASRKLTPFMILFGFYLLTYGHISPGGGFQGGVVIASGIILLSVSRGVETAERLFPVRSLSYLEWIGFFLIMAAGLAGMVAGRGFLGNPVTEIEVVSVPRVSMMLILNVLVGIKVGAGVSLICMRLFKES